MPIALILDALVAVLLVATIIYAWLLNRRLGGLRAHRDELEKTIGQFTEATKRAEASIQSLRAIAEQAARSLQGPVDRAQALRDELSFMIGRADDLAGRIGAPQAPASAPRPADALRPRPVEAMQPKPAVAPAPAAPAAVPRSGTGIPSSAKAASLASNPAPPAAPPAAPGGGEDAEGGRSKAERELLKALRELR